MRAIDPVQLFSIFVPNSEEFVKRELHRTITSSTTTKDNALGKLRISDRLFDDEVP